MADDRRVLRARESFVAPSPDGAEYFVRMNDLLPDDHPVIMGRESLFEPAEDTADRVIERATAAPGERRSLGGPKVAAARKQATQQRAVPDNPQA